MAEHRGAQIDRPARLTDLNAAETTLRVPRYLRCTHTAEVRSWSAPGMTHTAPTLALARLYRYSQPIDFVTRDF